MRESPPWRVVRFFDAELLATRFVSAFCNSSADREKDQMSPTWSIVFCNLEHGAMYKEGFVVANRDTLEHFHHVYRRSHVISKSTGLSNRNRRE